MKKSPLNEIKLLLFCAIIGAVSGILFWVFLFLVRNGTRLFWDLIPNRLLPYPWYPVLACTAGGLIIGLLHKKYGNYPEDMMTVFGTLKKTGTYPYRKIVVLAVSALLPLIFGASVGPEAGMVGIVVALCCWAGENMKFAGNLSREYSEIGAAVSLSVLFHSPLFGILDVEEGEERDSDNKASISGTTKILLYCVATGAGFGCIFLLNLVTGQKASGFPSFSNISLQTADYALFLLYLLCGILFGLFFEITEKLFARIASRIPVAAGEIIAGMILGTIACFIPAVRFSGEEALGELIEGFALYAPLAMIGLAFLKVLMTNLCIKLGLKGGHFFPLIFGAALLGYGISLLLFPGDGSHASFAAAVVTAGTLGVTLKKPLAVSMLMLLCFPVKSLLWIVPAAASASFASKTLTSKLNKEETAE